MRQTKLQPPFRLKHTSPLNPRGRVHADSDLRPLATAPDDDCSSLRDSPAAATTHIFPHSRDPSQSQWATLQSPVSQFVIDQLHNKPSPNSASVETPTVSVPLA
ncbi:unnamed protein product [Microthlaspi erraticum]|uniref:Uncharacterized protein n=1 Tax=Microthlaspi erraticum TaxID=1685480 RepID=A0A6D2JMK5_9BRAS|nr:unnamed protein product [Microthlaspi erraticum]